MASPAKVEVFHSANPRQLIGSYFRVSYSFEGKPLFHALGANGSITPDAELFPDRRDPRANNYLSEVDAIAAIRAAAGDPGVGRVLADGIELKPAPSAEQAKFDAYVSQLVKDSLARTAATPKQYTAPLEAANTGDIGMSIKGLNDFLQLAVEGARNAWQREPGLRSEFTSAEYEGFIMALATGNIEAAATGWAREFRATPAIRGEFITEQSYVAFKRDEFRRAERGMRRSR